MKFKKIIGECDMIPKWYGISHYTIQTVKEFHYCPNEMRMVIVCYPIPFNLIVPIFRGIWFLLKAPMLFFMIKKSGKNENDKS